MKGKGGLAGEIIKKSRPWGSRRGSEQQSWISTFTFYVRGVNQVEEEKMRRNEEELKKISSGIGKVKMLLRDS